MDFEEFKTILPKIMNKFGVDDIRDVEKNLSLQDKVSLYYLLQDDPEVCLQVLRTRSNENVITEWCEKISDKGEWKLRLIESLALMQNFKSLQRLGYEKIKLKEVQRVLDCADRSGGFDQRKALYKAVDSLTLDEIKIFISEIHDVPIKEPAELYSPLFAEIYLLEWQRSGVLSLDINSLSKLSLLLDKLNFKSASESLRASVESLWDVCQTNDDSSQGAQAQEMYQRECHGHPGVEDPRNCGDRYRIINKDHVGVCIVVNQNLYQESTGHRPRRGSKFDCDRLDRVMTKMKIKCICLENLPGNQIFSTIEETVRSNFNRQLHSILFVVIMAHGDRHCIFGTDGVAVECDDSIRATLSNARLPILKEIPKIVIYQACRGLAHFKENALEADGPCYTRPLIKASMRHYIICYSSIPGFKTYRDIKEGSLYINTLCDCLESSYQSSDLYSILTKVQNKFNSLQVVVEGQTIDMMAEFNSGLEAKVYLA